MRYLLRDMETSQAEGPSPTLPLQPAAIPLRNYIQTRRAMVWIGGFALKCGRGQQEPTRGGTLFDYS